MRILHIIFSFTSDGAETMLVDIINEQSKTTHVELIIINNLYNIDLIETINKNVKVHCLNRIPGSINPLIFFTLNYRVYKLKPNIIHFHSHNAIGLLRYKGIGRTFLTIHGLHRPLKYFNKYDKLISISNAVRNDLESRGSINSTTIYNGVDFSKIKIRWESFEDKTFKIADVSRLYHEIKGQDVLLKALHHLIYKIGITNVHLDFIGEGPSLTYLQNLVQELKLQCHVNFLGLLNRNTIYSIIQNYSLLVQPSIHEGFGLTIVEGMAAKIPVLVSNIPGPMEVIKNGKYGYYFESENSISCAEEIKNIFENKHAGRFTYKLNCAYDYATINYSIQKTASNYIKEYQKILNC